MSNLIDETVTFLKYKSITKKKTKKLNIVKSNKKTIQEELVNELIKLNGNKPLHPLNKNSTFKDKKYYDKAYKKWNKTNKLIEKAKQELQLV